MRTRTFVNDPTSPSRRRALALARVAEQLHAKLLKARQLQRMTQKQVAELLGVKQPTVAAFERYDNDPKMSSIISYAHAVGATISMSVTLDGVEVDLGWTPIAQATVPFTRSHIAGSRPTAAPHRLAMPMAAER